MNSMPCIVRRQPSFSGVLGMLLLALIAAPAAAQNGLQFSSGGNEVAIDTSRWSGARLAADRGNPGQFEADEPVLRLLTGGPGARAGGPDAACVTRASESVHRGRPFLKLTLAHACLDGRTIRLQIEGAPLRRRSKPAEIDDFEKNWLAVTFSNYDPEYDPGPGNVALHPPKPALPAFSGPRMRIEISTPTGAGIYRVTKDQMVRLGGFSTITPTDLKLTRGGVEIPILVSGAFIAPSDYIEFYGAPLFSETRPCNIGEQQQCPWEMGDYTDTEAYFLTLESGLRLRTTFLDGSVKGYLLAGSFLETVHREDNSRTPAFPPFDGFVDVPGETHFYDPTPIEIYSAGSNSYNFTLTVSNPAVSQPASIIVRVRERGDRFPAVSLHNAAFQLNNNNPSPAPVITDAQPPIPAVPGMSGNAFQWPNNATIPLAPIETFTVKFPPVVLLNGINTVKLIQSYVGNYDHQNLDWIELDYNRQYKAASDRLAFTIPAADTQVQISGLSAGANLSNLLLYEITNPDAPHGVSNLPGIAGQTLTAHFTGTGATRRFLLVPTGGVTLPDAVMSSAPDPGLSLPAASAKYLVIYHPDLIAGGTPALCPDTGTTITPWNCLLARKVKQFSNLPGNVKAIPIQDIYNEFSDGRFDPEAIHAFLKQAMTVWSPLPEYLLLVGDGTADLKDYYDRANATGPEPGYKNWVPTRLKDLPSDDFTGYWATDAQLADTNDNGLAELAVGRFSIRSPAELTAVLDKHTRYNGSTYQTWTGRSLCVTDKTALGFDVFEQICDSYAADTALQAPQTTTKLYYAQAPYNGNIGDASALFAPDLRLCMNGGNCPGNAAPLPAPAGGFGLINFIGHGNQFSWSEDAYFTEVAAFASPRNDTVTNTCHPAPLTNTTDVELLCQAPTQTAYMMIFNCLSGAFMSPFAQSILKNNGTDSLAEAAFKQSGGGPVGGLATSSTGFTTADDQQLLAFRNALNGPGKIRDWGILTQAIRAAPTGSYVANFSPVFFGDPAQVFKLPAPTPPVWDAIAPATAGNMRVTLKFTASTEGTTAYTRIYRAVQPSGSPAPGPFLPIFDRPTTPGEIVTYVDGNAACLAGYLTNTATYYYKLATLDGPKFEGAWTSTPSSVFATPMNPNPPATPTAVVLTDPGIGNSLDVSFTGVSDCDLLRYTLYWGPAANHIANSMNLALLPTSGSISGLTPNVTYFVSVSATNTTPPASSHESPRSTEAQGIPRLTNGGIRPAAAVTDLKLIKSGAADIRLNWTPTTTDIFGVTTPLTGQRVYRADLRGPGGYNFNLFSNPATNPVPPASQWPRTGFLDAPAVQPLTPASITWLDSGSRSGALTSLSLGYLVLESNSAGDSAASANLPFGVLDFKLKKSGTPGWLAGFFAPVTTDVSGQSLPSQPGYRVYRYSAASAVPCKIIALDRSPTHNCSIAFLNGSPQACESVASNASFCKNTDLGDANNYFYAILVEDGHGSSSSF